MRSCGSPEKFPLTGKTGNITPIFKGEKRNTWELQASQSQSVSGKIMMQILMETMLMHMDSKEMIGDCEDGFTKGKLCLTNLVAFYDVAMALADRRVTDVTYLASCKAFDTVLHDIE